jgi:uracil-DNA glycosylase
VKTKVRSTDNGVRAAQVPASGSLTVLRRDAKACRACDLWKLGTQTVFGLGPQNAPIVLVGEQPGDQEDLQGKPFVGPAGRLLDRALLAAGIDRQQVYVTNAVKHFKYLLRGKRRLHKSPSQRELLACNPWLQAELNVIGPKLIVALGATAVKAVLGKTVTIQAHRGNVLANAGAGNVLITVHPSFLLRMPTDDRAAAYQQFVADLKVAARFVKRIADSG